MKRRTVPPSPDPCLALSRRTRFRGGTLIAAEVHDLREHQRRVRRADGYRPPVCPRCHGERLHVHGRHYRVLIEGGSATRIEILRYVCANDACGATWRILPAFIARHLWRRWTTVARAITSERRRGASGVPAVAERTRRRWKLRLSSAARQLVLLLAQHDDEDVVRFARVAGFEGARLELVQLLTAGRVLGTHGHEDIAASIDRLERGIRLM